jgi:hypothetical protein
LASDNPSLQNTSKTADRFFHQLVGQLIVSAIPSSCLEEAVKHNEVTGSCAKAIVPEIIAIPTHDAKKIFWGRAKNFQKRRQNSTFRVGIALLITHSSTAWQMLTVILIHPLRL